MIFWQKRGWLVGENASSWSNHEKNSNKLKLIDVLQNDPYSSKKYQGHENQGTVEELFQIKRDKEHENNVMHGLILSSATNDIIWASGESWTGALSEG